MSVRIQLDRPHSHFTNLDLLTGRVILNLTSTLHVSTIVVKLEGESKTRLSAPQHPEFGRQKDVTELEVHKVGGWSSRAPEVRKGTDTDVLSSSDPVPSGGSVPVDGVEESGLCEYCLYSPRRPTRVPLSVQGRVLVHGKSGLMAEAS